MGRNYEFDFERDDMQAFDVFSELVFATREDDRYYDELEIWRSTGRKGPEPIYVGHVHNSTDMLRISGHKSSEIIRLREVAYSLIDDMKAKGEL